MPTQTDIKNSILKLNTEFFNLEPSSVVSMFELDLTTLGISADQQFIINLRDVQLSLPSVFPNGAEFDYSIIRLHNNVKLGKSIIYWNGNAYMPAPIKTEGFDLSSKGLFPKPKLSIAFSDDFLFTFALFKKVVQFDQLIGAKFTRIRTFAKFLDQKNFYQTDGVTPLISDPSSIPDGFSPDPNCEFPRDVYYFDRKSSENKNYLEFEMSSAIDLDRVKLPRRKVLSYTCPWIYRGEGCLYEDAALLSTSIHGTTNSIPNASSSDGTSAPPIAMEDDTLLSDLNPLNGINIKVVGPWVPKKEYALGEAVYITKNNINYYFVCKVPLCPKDVPPPNGAYWVADQCGKKISSCKIRFGSNPLPFGGFYGTSNYNRGNFQ